MTAEEKQQAKEIWAELENVVTSMDPNLNLKNYNLGLSNREGLPGIKDVIDLLRIQTKLLLHDVESTRREKQTLLKIIVEAEDE